MQRGPAVAVGRLAPGGRWVGFASDERGYRLVIGDESGELRSVPAADPGVRLDLLHVALAYFGDGAEAPPDELQATHGDLAELVRWLADTVEPRARPALRMAVDAIDDGLAADAVMLLLEEAALTIRGEAASEQADPIDLLAERYRALGG